MLQYPLQGDRSGHEASAKTPPVKLTMKIVVVSNEFPRFPASDAAGNGQGNMEGVSVLRARVLIILLLW